MKALILGGSGMLGHKLWQRLASQFETYATFRGSDFQRFGIFEESRAVAGVRAEDFDSVEGAFSSVQPEVVINCIGIVKQGAAAKNSIATININSLFPHRLAQLCRKTNTRLIHISTDCVFSGRTGNYSEDDLPDPPDVYGRSKLLGEVEGENCLTIRTSMIGRELKCAHGLLEWFFSQGDAHVRGFKRAIFSGFTSQALADIIENIITEHHGLNGVWHVAAEPTSKFDLLALVKQTYGLAAEIEPDEAFVCDRSLNGARFNSTTGYRPPSWPEMIERMHKDKTPYDDIRRLNA